MWEVQQVVVVVRKNGIKLNHQNFNLYAGCIHLEIFQVHHKEVQYR